jgi:RNA polymerase sigma factor (TIGR02999 family)
MERIQDFAFLNGDGQVESIDLSRIFPEVYAELKQLAAARLVREVQAHSWGATALVNEAFLRLAQQQGSDKPFETRRHFFSAAAETMRRILIDAARARQTEKRGGDSLRIELTDDAAQSRLIDPGEALALHELLDQFAQKHPRQAETLKLRYFLGCTFVEIGEIFGHSPDTAHDDWTFARAWFRQRWKD